MAYEVTVVVPGRIGPQGEGSQPGDFPVVQAKDIYVKDDTEGTTDGRLDKYLTDNDINIQTLNTKVEAFGAGGVHDVAALETRVDTAEGKINSLQADSHTHDNKTVLDGITTEKVTAWDGEIGAKTVAATAQADVDTLNTRIGKKTDASTVETVYGAINGKQDALTAGEGITISGQTIELNSIYERYLKDKTFERPEIKNFALLDSNGSSINSAQETGSSITVESIRYKATTPGNIDDNTLKLHRGNDFIQNIEIPESEEIQTVVLTSQISSIISNTSFKLEGQYTLNGTSSKFSDSVTLNFNDYLYYGCGSSESDPPTSEDLPVTSKGPALSDFVDSAAGKKFEYESGQYLWLIAKGNSYDVQTYALSTWGSVTFTTVPLNNFVKANGITDQMTAYIVGPFSQKGEAIYRLASS